MCWFSVNIVEVIQEAGKSIATFAGIKYTDGDMNTGSACANLDPKRYRVFLGCDQVVRPPRRLFAPTVVQCVRELIRPFLFVKVMSGAYLLGFRSCIATSVNVFPSICLGILEAAKAGKFSDAQQLQKKLMEAINVITKYGESRESRDKAYFHRLIRHSLADRMRIPAAETGMWKYNKNMAKSKCLV